MCICDELNALSQQCNAQDSKSSLALTSGKSSFYMPFELVDNRIFIDVQLNGKGPFKFILDTGEYAQVSLEAARAAMANLPGQLQISARFNFSKGTIYSRLNSRGQ
jgi:hypothetical protein